MSQPQEPDPVKLVASVFSPHGEQIDSVITELIDIFGATDWVSPEIPFNRTQYYAKEMGWPLYRRFVSFEKLISAEHLPTIKLETNRVERQHLHGGKRRVNIDPGYISPERLILATGKNYVHRIYLSKGIYGDLTLVYQRGSFRALDWTYPDYAATETILMFNDVRKIYMNQIREMRSIGKEHDGLRE
jgi:hypothetical protein